MSQWCNNILSLFSAKNITLRNFTVYLLVIMLIQYIPIESRSGVSPVKVLTMLVVPFVLIKYFQITKAFICVAAYFSYIIFTSYFLHPASFRASTVIYMLMFLLTYMAFYNFIWVQKVFSLEFFISFIKVFILTLAGVLVIQQLFIVVGVKYLPVINLCQVLNRGIGSNSLSYEPSSLARTMGVLYYAYLKCNEYLTGHKMGVVSIFSGQHRLVTLSFLWSMATMGSGTAFLCLAVLSLYFMRGFQFLWSIPIFIGVYFALSYFEVRQFERVRNVAEATMFGDAQDVVEADGSAAVRLKPVLNTLNIDLSKPESWFGEGCDSWLRGGFYGDERYMGEINDYGLIAYIGTLIMVFVCAIDLLSLPTIMFFIGIGGGTGNIAYGWGILMVFTCVKYFSKNRE